MVSLSCGSEIESTTEEAARAVAGEKLVQRLSGYLNGNGTVDVMHTLRRLREFAETTGPEQAEDHLGNGVWFVTTSEHLWDRDEIEAAAQARRIACRFFEIAGATSELAVELGWLGTLEKQLGRTAAAETLYQRAVALGEEDLDVEQLASLVGRYANLLHQLGQRQAALALQWRATCLLSAGLDRDEPLTEDGLGKLPAQEPEVSLGNRMGWLLQLANLANCLFDTGQPALADQALAPAEVRFAELAGSAKAVDEKHVRAAADMLVRVRSRLELLKGEQGDPEGCA
jgi:tetratricopeptide (TPR) repeat protein